MKRFKTNTFNQIFGKAGGQSISNMGAFQNIFQPNLLQQTPIETTAPEDYLKLSDKDKASIKSTIENCSYTFQRQLLAKSQFNVGDILLRRYVYNYDEDEKSNDIEKYDGSNMYMRYIVVHVCPETTFPFVKAFDEDGNLESHIEMAFDDSASPEEHYIYEVDPLYIDATLLDHKFDIQELFKEQVEHKKNVIASREQLAFKPNDLKELRDWADKNVKKGQTIYYHHKANFDNDYGVTAFKVKDMTKTPIRKDLTKITNKWGFSLDFNNGQWMLEHVWYTVKPQKFDESHSFNQDED